VSIVRVLPELRAAGGAQMALDSGLLETADQVIARRYTWAPPALSLGRFQKYEPVPGLPFDVVRRPSGGRAVLHGEGFEWSFAVAFPAGALGAGARAGLDVAKPYDVVAGPSPPPSTRSASRWTAGASPPTSALPCASRACCGTI